MQYYPAPGKLNLMLHINGRREDGFHLLQTVFQILDYGDQIGLELRQDEQIVRLNDFPQVPDQEDDLVVKAARLLKSQALKSVPGVNIDVKKNLPSGGGVGGGSSDAATVLLILNKLWSLSLDSGKLADLGLRLGADVPVFVRAHSAWAEGVGEKLQAIELPEKHFLVVFPGCHVSTGEIFSDSQLTRTTGLTTIADFLAQGGRNDCEPVVIKRYPQVARAIDWLNQYGHAKLTGTGACIFAEFADRQSAQNVLEQLPAEYTGFVAKGVNRSPLLQFV